MKTRSQVIGKCWKCRQPVCVTHARRKVLDAGMERLVHESCYQSGNWPEELLTKEFGAEVVSSKPTGAIVNMIRESKKTAPSLFDTGERD